MSNDRIFYKMDEGGFADTQIKIFTEKYQAVNKSWFDFVEKYGAEQVYASDSIEAVVFGKTNPPEEWVSLKKWPNNCFRPAKKKICIDAYYEFNSLKRKPSGMDLSTLLKVGSVFGGNGRIYFPSFEHVGESVLLSLHKDSDIPGGVTALKNSEYWAMKEAIVA